MVLICSRSFILFCLLLCYHLGQSQWSISGHVIDANSGEGLAYVNIHADNTTLGTTSDQKGNFRIDGLTSLQQGITFSMIGYQTTHVESLSPESGPLFIRLTPEVYITDEVVISASRKSQSLSLAPASVGLLSKSQLKAQGSKSFDDAFHQINGIQVTRSSGANVQSLSIRGASDVAGGGIGNRVLLLLDGRPAITPESGGALWNLMPLGAIERIEVIKGAYSSLFGSSAMGGIINVITLTPDTSPVTDLNVQYGFYQKPPAFADYDEYNDFYSIDLTHSSTQGKWSYVLNGARKADEGHREKSSFTTYNAYGKLIYHFSPNRSFQASLMYNDIFNDTPATWLSPFQPYHVAAYRKDDTQHRREINGDFHYVAFAHAHIKYSARFYYYGSISDFIFNGDPDNDSTNINFGRQFIDEEKVIVHRLGHITQLDFSMGDDHYLIGGLELQSDYVDGRPDTVLYGLHKAWNIGAFVQDQWMIGDKLIVTGGIRYDHYKITKTFSEGNVSPKLAFVYKTNDRVSVRALLARAFRNPSIAERYTKFEQGGGLRFVVNPGLRSEKLTLSTEAGIKWTGKKLSTDLSLFYNQYNDLIYFQQRPMPGELLFEVINLNKAIMQGIEFSVEYWPLKWMKWSAGYTYLDARDVSETRFNDVLPYKSKHTGFASLFIERGKFNFFLQGRGRSRIDEVFIYPGSEPAGYVLFNSKLSYSFEKNISAFLSVQNITNEMYEEIERYRLPGRTYAMGFNFRIQ